MGTAAVFSFNLVLLGRFSKEFDPVAITFAQFAVAGALFLACAALTEPGPTAAWARPEVLASVAYLFLGATMAAQVMQNVGLRSVPPQQASIIMCTESVWALGLSAVFWGEVVTPLNWVGFGLIFSAMLISAVRR